jgi:hypothetical protein
MRDSIRFLTLAAAVAGSLVCITGSSGDPPATQATTAPAVAGVDAGQLIKQLGSDDPDARDAAQKQLVDLGPSVVPALKKAAETDEDPEIRSRASAALAQMKDRDDNDTTYITLHMKDAAAQDVTDALATQAHTKFVGLSGVGLPANAAGRNLTVDADHKPFWEVMSDVCTQLNVCPALDMPGRNSLRLYTTPQNWMMSPHQVVGPYWISAAGIYRSRSINLMGAQAVDDQCFIRLIVYPEPKLAVTQIAELKLKEVTDDAGNSLLPQPQAGAAAVLNSMRAIRSVNHIVESRLSYPANPGKRIAVLRGDVTALLAEDLQQFQVDDVLGAAPRVTNPLTKCSVKATVVKQNTEMYRVTMECTRDGLPDDKWQAMMSRMNDLSLEDADGHALTPLGFGGAVPTSDNTFTGTCLFTRSASGMMIMARGVGAANPAAAQPAAKAGEPKRLTWNVATRLRTVTIPVELKDLPMP